MFAGGLFVRWCRPRLFGASLRCRSRWGARADRVGRGCDASSVRGVVLAGGSEGAPLPGRAKSVEAVTIPPRYAGCPRLRIVSTRVLKPPGTGWTSSSGAGWTGFVKGAVAGVNGAAGRLSASGISFDCQIHNFRAVACRAEGLLLGVSERGLSRGDAGRVSKGCRVHDLELSLAAGGVVPSPEGVRALG